MANRIKTYTWGTLETEKADVNLDKIALVKYESTPSGLVTKIYFGEGLTVTLPGNMHDQVIADMKGGRTKTLING